MLPFLTLAEIRSYIDVRSGVTKYDERMKASIMSASQLIENSLRRSFDYKTRTEYFSSRDTFSSYLDLRGDSLTGSVPIVNNQTLSLAGLPIDMTQPIVVKYDPTARLFDDTTIVDPTRYTLVPDKGLITLNTPMTRRYRALQVTYNAGLVGTEDPDAGWMTISDALDAPENATFAILKQACIIQSMFWWNRMDPKTLGMTSDDDARGRTNTFVIKGGILPDVIGLIAQFRRPVNGAG